MDVTTEERAVTLQAMQICRFCLREDVPLINIYAKSESEAIPLPLQIMAFLGIEVYESDGMPQFICSGCEMYTTKANNVKACAKRSDNALRMYLLTGSLEKPKMPANTTKKTTVAPMPTASEDDGEIIIQRVEEKHEENIECNQMDEQTTREPIEEMYANEGSTGSESNLVSKVPHIETNVYPCTRCERTFALQQLLELHMKNHDRDREFECEICDRKYFTKYDLNKHILTHTTDKPFKCVACEKTFARESLLHRHEKTHHDVPKYLCSDCDQTFLTRDDLDAHAEKHKKRRPFTCRICNKGFVFKQGLERHEVSHADEKPHKCNYCEASFTSPIKLMRHITSHAGLRPYPCKLCGRTFLLSHHLTRHMHTHYAATSSSVEPVGAHKCDVCSMSFRRKDSLINHSAIHSMVNLKCVICNTEFVSAKDVKEHITTHLAGLPYPCDKCDYSFETQDQLEEHELKHAEMEYELQIEREVTAEVRQERKLRSRRRRRRRRRIAEVDTMDEEEEEEEEDEEETIAEIAGEEEDVGEEEDEDDGSILEFTLTTDAEVIPRPKRAKRQELVTYVKEELASEGEQEEEYVIQAGVDGTDGMTLEAIKPIVRTEGTKVYRRKGMNKRLPEHQRQQQVLSVGDSINLDTLGLTQEFVKDLPNDQYVVMKGGDRFYKVKKFMVRKPEFEAAARGQNVDMQGGSILVKTSAANCKTTPATSTRKNITIEGILDETRPAAVQRPTVTKTYVKRSTSTTQLQEEQPLKDEPQLLESSVAEVDEVQMDEILQ